MFDINRVHYSSDSRALLPCTPPSLYRQYMTHPRLDFQKWSILEGCRLALSRLFRESVVLPPISYRCRSLAAVMPRLRVRRIADLARDRSGNVLIEAALVFPI